MKFVTWNVNSLSVRIGHVLDWLREHQPDVICLQETKQEDSKFPYDALREIGYEAIHSGQKTYNGVAIISRHPMTNIQRNMPDFEDSHQRVIAADIEGIRVICAYIPNGQAVDSDKYVYKLNWLQAFNTWVKSQLVIHPKLVVLGDYNIAPEDRDCHDPAAWEGQVLCSPKERQAFQELLGLGLHDSFRLFDQPEKSYSWWDYRMLGFRRNFGLRIDHILVSEALKSSCKSVHIDRAPRKLERPSDHTPVVLELNPN